MLFLSLKRRAKIIFFRIIPASVLILDTLPLSWLRKKRYACKPDSVESYHLSDAAYPPASGEQPSNAGLHGLANCRCVRPPLSLTAPVGSYPTFSPLPVNWRTVIFCYAIHKLTPVCAFHSAALCIVRTFLPCKTGAIGRHTDSTKIIKN